MFAMSRHCICKFATSGCHLPPKDFSCGFSGTQNKIQQMQARQTCNEAHSAAISATDDMPEPLPIRFDRRPLSGLLLLSAPHGDKVAQTPAVTPHPDKQQSTSALQRSEYNRRVGEMIQMDIECSCNDLQTMEQRRVFDEVWQQLLLTICEPMKIKLL